MEPSETANEYVSGTNDAVAQAALRTNLRNPRSEIGTGLLEWMGPPSVTPSSAPTTLLRDFFKRCIYATDAVGRIT
jgi:hypothetical protein